MFTLSKTETEAFQKWERVIGMRRAMKFPFDNQPVFRRITGVSHEMLALHNAQYTEATLPDDERNARWLREHGVTQVLQNEV